MIVDDKDLTRTRRTGATWVMVFQAYSLFPNLTARHNVEFGLRIRRRPRPSVRSAPMSCWSSSASPSSATAQEEALSISDRVAVMNAGRPEQIASPAEIYGEPATPFVAEFVGTMNRLEATVVVGGRVRHADTELAVTASSGCSTGERVLVLIHPEALSMEPLTDGSASALSGRVVAHVFLGPVTRLKIDTPAGQHLAADVASATAARFQVGDRVTATFDAGRARLLDLPAI